MNENCMMRNCDCILEIIILRRMVNTGTGCPDILWNLHPGDKSKNNWI